MPAKKSAVKSTKNAVTKTSSVAKKAVKKAVKKVAKRPAKAPAKRSVASEEEHATGLRGMLANIREKIVGDEAHPSKLAQGAHAIGEKVAAAGKLAVKGERMVVEYAAKKLGRKKSVAKKAPAKKSTAKKAAPKKSAVKKSIGTTAAKKATAGELEG